MQKTISESLNKTSIASLLSESPNPDIINMSTEELLELIEMTKQPKKEQEILKQRYGLRDQKPVTQREIAKKMQISRSYVSRIEKKALEKLKNNF